MSDKPQRRQSLMLIEVGGKSPASLLAKISDASAVVSSKNFFAVSIGASSAVRPS